MHATNVILILVVRLKFIWDLSCAPQIWSFLLFLICAHHIDSSTCCLENIDFDSSWKPQFSVGFQLYATIFICILVTVVRHTFYLDFNYATYISFGFQLYTIHLIRISVARYQYHQDLGRMPQKENNKHWVWSRVNVYDEFQSSRSRKHAENKLLLASIGIDPAEIRPSEAGILWSSGVSKLGFAEIAMKSGRTRRTTDGRLEHVRASSGCTSSIHCTDDPGLSRLLRAIAYSNSNLL